jgi:hypothetical protein
MIGLDNDYEESFFTNFDEWKDMLPIFKMDVDILQLICQTVENLNQEMHGKFDFSIIPASMFRQREMVEGKDVFELQDLKKITKKPNGLRYEIEIE